MLESVLGEYSILFCRSVVTIASVRRALRLCCHCWIVGRNAAHGPQPGLMNNEQHRLPALAQRRQRRSRLARPSVRTPARQHRPAGRGGARTRLRDVKVPLQPRDLGAEAQCVGHSCQCTDSSAGRHQLAGATRVHPGIDRRSGAVDHDDRRAPQERRVPSQVRAPPARSGSDRSNGSRAARHAKRAARFRL